MKQTLKEIRAQVRQEVSKEYKRTYENKINSLNERLTRLVKENKELDKKIQVLTNQNDELIQKNQMCEDWIQRLQNFVNMSDEDREKEIESLRKRQHAREEMSIIFDKLSPYFKYFN